MRIGSCWSLAMLMAVAVGCSDNGSTADESGDGGTGSTVSDDGGSSDDSGTGAGDGSGDSTGGTADTGATGDGGTSGSTTDGGDDDPPGYTPERIYYVSTSGNDEADGLTEATAWRTLHHAEASAVVPGDGIALRRGDVFMMDETLGISHGGSATKPIVWDGGLWGDGPNAVIRASSDRDAPNLAVVHFSDCQHLQFQRITVDADSHHAFGIVVGGTDSYYAPGTVQNAESDIIIQYSEVLDCGDESDDYVICVLFQTWNNDMADIVFRNNRVDGATNHAVTAYVGREEHGATPSVLHGVSMVENFVTNFGKNNDSRSSAISVSQEVDGALIERNTIEQGTDGHNAAIVIAGSPQGSPSGIVVRYNDVRMRDNSALSVQNGYTIGALVYGNVFYAANPAGGAAIWLQIAPGVGYEQSAFGFHHNTVVVEEGVSFMDDTTTPGVTSFTNNALVNLGVGEYDDLCYVANMADSVEHNNNLFFRPGANDGAVAVENDGGYVLASEATIWEPGAVVGDPRLVDLEGFDWRIREDSAARGAGQAVPGIDVDRAGNSYEDPPSIGAYEYAP